VTAILLCIAFVDRAASTWSHLYLQRREYFVWMQHLGDPIVPSASAGLLIAACAVLAGRRPGRQVRVLLACCVAEIMAAVLKDQLKLVFGRTWTETFIDNNPLWIQNGVYGFWPFHGGRGWASFPSGHASVISAPMAVLWSRVRSLRWLWGACVVIVATGLFGADYHFSSDILAGILLGILCAAVTLVLIERQESRAPLQAK
jgi:membrane-associated phospholipid phosphatase